MLYLSYKYYGIIMTSIINDIKLILESSPKDVSLEKLHGCMLLKHLFWKQNQQAMRDATKWFEEKMLDVAESDKDDGIKTLTIRQLSGLLPYVMPFDHKEVVIPVLQRNVWVPVQYEIRSIGLLPKWIPSSDQLYALALRANGCDSQLLFKGTTYPTDQGFWSTILADLFPFMDIGKLIMIFGKSKISLWANTQQNIHIVGQSLGGALANMSHDVPNIRTITTINPALPYAKRGCSKGVIRTMIVDNDDPISRIGQIDDDINVVKTTLNTDGVPMIKRKYLGHAQPRLSYPGVVIETLVEAEKQQHTVTNRMLWYWVLRAIVFLLILPVYLIHLVYAYLYDLFV